MKLGNKWIGIDVDVVMNVLDKCQVCMVVMNVLDICLVFMVALHFLLLNTGPPSLLYHLSNIAHLCSSLLSSHSSLRYHILNTSLLSLRYGL